MLAAAPFARRSAKPIVATIGQNVRAWFKLRSGLVWNIPIEGDACP